MVRDFCVMYLAKWKRLTVVLLFFWLIVAYIVMTPMKCGNSSEEVIEFQIRLKAVSLQLETMKQVHNNLIDQIKNTSGGKPSFIGGSQFMGLLSGPSEEYEDLKRRIYTNTKEMWYYISNELRDVLRSDNKDEHLLQIVNQTLHRKLSILSDLEILNEFDGYKEWKINEAANVSDLIQRRLYFLQNPANCRDARKLICHLNKGCGFGCQLHHIVYCLIFAYATERTLILNSKGWRYNPKGWDYVFHPLSSTCTSIYDEKVNNWPVLYDVKVVSLPYIDGIYKPKFLPLAIPKDLAHRIIQFNGDPASWWIGQILKYILKPLPSMEKAINDTIGKMNFKNPIVGVHIRRTDKVGTEADLHQIDEYMSKVKEYFDKIEINQVINTRRVYLASDDPTVIEDARKKYPEYEFLGDPAIAKTAATHRRYTPVSLTGLLVDLHMLARCDYLVCTFSSQVGRVAYEMMQANRLDASNDFFSLDDIYYFGGQNSHNRKAVMSHKAQRDEEMSFEVGDLIGIAGNHWDGFGLGVNKRNNQKGLVPWYKTADHLVFYPFPEYPQVPLHADKNDKQNL